MTATIYYSYFKTSFLKY